MSWTVASNHQVKVIGVSGRRGDHAAQRVEKDTGRVLGHSLI